MQLLPSRLRPFASRAPSPPSFAASGFVPLDRPFCEAIVVFGDTPGEASLQTRLSVGEPVEVAVHWEVARQPDFHERERYGVLLALPTANHRIQVSLTGLEPGRRYWGRFWAGGHWSHAVLLHSASHQTQRSAMPPSFARTLHRNAS